MNICVSIKNFRFPAAPGQSELGPTELTELQTLVLVQHPVDAIQRNGSPIPFLFHLLGPSQLALRQEFAWRQTACTRQAGATPPGRSLACGNQNFAPPNSETCSLFFFSSTQLMQFKRNAPHSFSFGCTCSGGVNPPCAKVLPDGKTLVRATRGGPPGRCGASGSQNFAPPNSLSFKLLFLSSTQLMLHRAPKRSSLLPL